MLSGKAPSKTLSETDEDQKSGGEAAKTLLKWGRRDASDIRQTHKNGTQKYQKPNGPVTQHRIASENLRLTDEDGKLKLAHRIKEDVGLDPQIT